MSELFRITHENGTLSEYTDISNIDGGDISVTTQAAILGNYGLSILYDDNLNLYVTKDFTAPEMFMRLGFKLNVNSLPMGASDFFRLIEFTDSSNNLQGFLNFLKVSGNYRLELAFFDDGSVLRSTASQTITNAIHDVQLLIKRASSNSSIDAYLELWVDGVKIGERRNIDIFDRTKATRLRVGGFSVDTGTRGTLFVDAIVLTNTSDPITQPIIDDSGINILNLDAGATLSRWNALEGASKTLSSISFPKEASGTPARVEYAFSVNRFRLNKPHRFTGKIIPTILNYPHSDVKWFVKNVTTGQIQFHQISFDGHSDQGGSLEINEPKEFNIVFHPKSVNDQFTVGFENFANNQEGFSFNVEDLGVFIIN